MCFHHFFPFHLHYLQKTAHKQHTKNSKHNWKNCKSCCSLTLQLIYIKTIAPLRGTNLIVWFAAKIFILEIASIIVPELATVHRYSIFYRKNTTDSKYYGENSSTNKRRLSFWFFNRHWQRKLIFLIILKG